MTYMVTATLREIAGNGGWLPLHYEPSVDLERKRERICVCLRESVCEREKVGKKKS